MQGSWRSQQVQKRPVISNEGYGITGGISPLLQGSYLETYDNYDLTKDGLPAYFGEMQGPGVELEDPLEKDSGDSESEIFRNDPPCQENISHVPKPKMDSLGTPQSFPRLDSAITKLDLPSQINVSIPETFLQQEAENQYTIFNIRLSSNIRNWQVLRRYSQFLSLHEILSRKTPSFGHKLPQLPGKRVFGSSLEPHFVEQRRQDLQTYLQQLCKIAEVWDSKDFIAFLDDSSSFITMQLQYGKLVDYVSELEGLCHQMQSHLELYRVNLETQSSEMERLRQQVASLESQWKNEGFEQGQEGVQQPHLQHQMMRHSVSENVLGRTKTYGHDPDPRTIQHHQTIRAGSPGMSLFSTWNISRTPQSHAISIPLGGESRDSDDEMAYPMEHSLAHTPSSAIFRNIFSPASPPLGMSAPGLENLMPGYALLKPQPAPSLSRGHADPEQLSEDVLPLSMLASAAGLSPLDRRAAQLLHLIAPTPHSHAYRASMFAFISHQVRRTLGAQCFAVGPYAVRAYLPDEDVAVSAFLCRGQEQTWFIRLNEALCKLSSETQMEGGMGFGAPLGTETPGNGITTGSPEGVPGLEASLSSLGMSKESASTSDAEDGQLFHHLLSNVNFVNSREGNQRIKCLVDNVSVDVGANQLGDLTLVAFLEDADQRVDSHLFKKSLLLIKAWWVYETRPLAASSAISLLDADCLAVMVLALLTSPPVCPHTGQPVRLTTPVQVAATFFAVYARFQWDKYCVTLEGPKLLSSLNSPLASAEVSTPPPTALFPSAAMEKYVSSFSLATTGASSGKKSSSHSDEESSRTPSRCNSPGPTTTRGRGGLIRMDSNNSEDTNTSGSKDEAPTPTKLPFPVRAMNVVHPLDSSMNMVDEGMNKRKANRALSLLQTGAKTLHLVLKSLKEDLDDQASNGEGGGRCENQDLPLNYQSLQQWDAMFALTWARFGQGWRPDAPYPLVELEGLKKRPPNQQLHEATTAPTSQAKGQRDSSGEVLSGELSVLWENLKYCSFLLESEVTDSALRTLTKEILGEKGPLPVGEIGKLLQEATSNATLSTTLKDQFGGLKKFLEKYPEDFLISVDHPFNPHVYLKSVLNEEEIQQIMSGELAPATTSKKSKKASRRSKKTAGQESAAKEGVGKEDKGSSAGGLAGDQIPSGQTAGPPGLALRERQGSLNSHQQLTSSELRQAMAATTSQQATLHSLRMASLGGVGQTQLQPGVQIAEHTQTQQVRYVSGPPGLGLGGLMEGGHSQHQLSATHHVVHHQGGQGLVSQHSHSHSQGGQGTGQQLYGINVGGQIQLYKQQVVGLGTNGAQILRMVPLSSQQSQTQHQHLSHGTTPAQLQHSLSGAGHSHSQQQSRGGLAGGGGLPPHHLSARAQGQGQKQGGGLRNSLRAAAAIEFPHNSAQNLHRFPR